MKRNETEIQKKNFNFSSFDSVFMSTKVSFDIFWFCFDSLASLTELLLLVFLWRSCVLFSSAVCELGGVILAAVVLKTKLEKAQKREKDSTRNWSDHNVCECVERRPCSHGTHMFIFYAYSVQFRYVGMCVWVCVHNVRGGAVYDFSVVVFALRNEQWTETERNDNHRNQQLA